MAEPTKADLLACAKRELGLRRAVYPRRVQQHLMAQAKADREIACMEAIVRLLEPLAEAEKPADLFAMPRQHSVQDVIMDEYKRLAAKALASGHTVVLMDGDKEVGRIGPGGAANPTFGSPYWVVKRKRPDGNLYWSGNPAWTDDLRRAYRFRGEALASDALTAIVGEYGQECVLERHAE